MNERETISAPVTMYDRDQGDPIVGLRIHGAAQVFELSETAQRFRLGADDACEVGIDDSYVSGVHCVLERRGRGRLVAVDNGSKNGTFVDGKRVDAAELEVGSVLRVGKTTLVAVGAEQVRIAARDRLVGESPAFCEAVGVALRAAMSECSVLVVGETGTGKELFARLVHEASTRHVEPFVAVNCGAIPRELVESELFGHIKGSFTGAVTDREGVFVQADRGTLFLDELGELPRAQQPALLRVLETRRVRRLGDRSERDVDVRVVAATNRLELGGADSPLREDLYHRLATLTIEIPPLRDRADDVPLLVDAFSKELFSQFGPRHIEPETLDALCDYEWPGNVRELRHAVQRATALSEEELLLDDLLPPKRLRRPTQPIEPISSPIDPILSAIDAMSTPIAGTPDSNAGVPTPIAGIRDSNPVPTPVAGIADPVSGVPTPVARESCAAQSLYESITRDGFSLYESVNRKLILAAYDRYGSVRKAARALGMPRSTFADKLRRYQKAG